MYNCYGGILDYPPKKNEEIFMKFNVKDLVKQAVIAALYVGMTFITYTWSYLEVQFRLSEILMILILFDRRHVIGLTIGCLFANFFNPTWMPLDLFIGTFATFLGGILMIPLQRKPFVALLFPVLTNAFLVPISLYFYADVPYFAGVLGVGIGEVTMVYILGNLLYIPLKRNKGFVELISNKENLISDKDE